MQLFCREAMEKWNEPKTYIYLVKYHFIICVWSSWKSKNRKGMGCITWIYKTWHCHIISVAQAFFMHPSFPFFVQHGCIWMCISHNDSCLLAAGDLKLFVTQDKQCRRVQGFTWAGLWGGSISFAVRLVDLHIKDLLINRDLLPKWVLLRSTKWISAISRECTRVCRY